MKFPDIPGNIAPGNGDTVFDSIAVLKITFRFSFSCYGVNSK